MRPIEIIGGGLAGLSLGLALRRSGVGVTLFEAGTYPRHRVCGEFIAGLDAPTMATLRLQPFLQDALHHRDVVWFMEEKQICRQQLPTAALAISRHRLDARLAEAFVAAGGELHPHTRQPVEADREGQVVTTGRRRTRSDWLGLKIHARHLPLECDLELHLGDNAYIGLTRVEDGRVNVCGLFRRRTLMTKGPALIPAYLRAAQLPGLAQRLEAADPDANSFTAVAAVDFDAAIHVNDHLSLGDACAMIPPFTGNGMAMAFQSAALSLDPLLAYASGSAGWQETVTGIDAALRQRFRVRLATANLLHPFLLRAPRQRWLARLAKAHLLPFRPLYSALH